MGEDAAGYDSRIYPPRRFCPDGPRRGRFAAGEKKKNSSEQGNDGWIVQWIDYAARRYGWSYREIMWEIPASAIALLLRCDRVAENRIFPLSEIEKIDDGEKA